MNVLVIPEDFRKDQFILKPIIEAMFSELGRRRAHVEVCRELLRGISQAMDWGRISDILSRYKGMVDIFLLIVDRDGESGRRTALDGLEQRATGHLPAGRLFFAENAWQEVEVWVLAGHELPEAWKWTAVRQEVHPKEVYFEPFAARRDLLDEPGGGRRTLAREAAARYGRIRQLCPEDVAALEDRISKGVSR